MTSIFSDDENELQRFEILVDGVSVGKIDDSQSSAKCSAGLMLMHASKEDGVVSIVMCSIAHPLSLLFKFSEY